MAADDVAYALMMLDDERVRSAVAKGDFAALGKLDLDKKEQEYFGWLRPTTPNLPACCATS